jgi:hypothetical protein
VKRDKIAKLQSTNFNSIFNTTLNLHFILLVLKSSKCPRNDDDEEVDDGIENSIKRSAATAAAATSSSSPPSKKPKPDDNFGKSISPSSSSSSASTLCVQHECFGVARGTLNPEKYTSPRAKCIKCCECGELQFGKVTSSQVTARSGNCTAPRRKMPRPDLDGLLICANCVDVVKVKW